MPRFSYGTRNDAQIEQGIRSGIPIKRIAERLGVSDSYVGKRGRVLGLGDLIYSNGCKAKARGSAAMKRVNFNRTARDWRGFVANFGKSPGDRLISDVARSLRGRPAELSDAAIAALHERGLTVDELCAGTSRAPWMIIRAVREAARCA